jgi:SAM-dependent methyltransferase
VVAVQTHTANPQAVFENIGYCPCCRSATTFVAHEAWLRDYYRCSICGSIPRERHLQHVLDEQFPGWEGSSLHESSPSNDFIRRYALDYSCSQFFPDVPRGATRGAIRSEDIENLTYPDGSIDIFITQDVMEHVFNPDRAIAEIHRVLRPGGAHVFTAPKHKGLLESRQRARLHPDGTVEHLLDAQYHGNPIDDGGALVTWDYGYDFEQLMSVWSGASVAAVHTVDRSFGIDAEHNEVFVIRKPTHGWPVGGPAPTDGRVAAALRPLKGPARALSTEIGRLGKRVARKGVRTVQQQVSARRK